MLHLNRAFIFIITVLLFAGCMPSARIAGFKGKQLNTIAFFKDIPEVWDGKYSGIRIYKTSFKERYIESNSTLQYALLNDSGEKAVKYLDAQGDKQDVYLVCIEKTDKPLVPYACVYLSVKYNAMGRCIGFGPAYYGHYDAYKKVINFTDRIKINKEDDSTYAVVRKHSKEKLIFLPDGGIAKPLPEQIRIEKIILAENNKVGGLRPVIFDVAELMKDINIRYLYFNHVYTIPLN